VNGARRLEVLGGTGTVSRTGSTLAWFAPGFPPIVAEELLELATSAPVAEGAAGLAGALEAAASASTAAFGIVVETEAATSVVVRGHVVVSEDGLERLRGDTSLASVDLPVGGTLTVRGETDPDQLDRPGSVPFDLRDGVVPGGGITLWGVERLRPMPEPALDEHVVLFDLSTPELQREPLPLAPPSLVVPETAARADGSGGLPETKVKAAVPAEQATAVPTEVPPAAAAEAAADVEPPPPPPSVPSVAAHAVSLGQQVVQGVSCARGHFNNPHALYCGICGLAMVQNSVVLVSGLRPPLGVLLLDDGTAYSLDGDYVLGRQPELADDVAKGRARPIKVDDGTGKISRVHAAVNIRGWDVVISDLGSHNGTRVFNIGEPTWRTLHAEESVQLKPGGRLVIGQFTFEFQSIQRQ
jgi:hypothetical protein